MERSKIIWETQSNMTLDENNGLLITRVYAELVLLAPGESTYVLSIEANGQQLAAHDISKELHDLLIKELSKDPEWFGDGKIVRNIKGDER